MTHHERHLLPQKLTAPYRGKSSTVVSMVMRNQEPAFQVFAQSERDAKTEPEDLIFEIGSVTKVFTAILMAVLVEEGTLDPHRPIGELCHDLSEAPSWITPMNLVTHTSGLPRLHVPVWKVLISSLPDDPYADFSRDDLIRWLKDRSATTPPKRVRHAYSNLGFGLLGEVISMIEGRDYMDLLKEKVLDPIGLADTGNNPDSGQQRRFMQPRDVRGRAVSPWTFKAMAAAGCLRSTAGDLARFSAHVNRAIEDPSSVLDRAIRRSVQPVRGLGPRGSMEPVSQCWGWLGMAFDPDAPRMLFHDGGTAGSTVSLYVCPQKKASVAILCNRGVTAGLWSSLQLARSQPHQRVSDVFKSI